MIKRFTHLSIFLLTAVFTFSTFISFAQLNGNYTIGSGGNYASFNAAVSALGAGVTGPVTFTVNQGTYTERVEITAISGASATNRITFNGVDKANRKITYAGTTTNDRAVVVLNGASYITFKNITIESTGQNDNATSVFLTQNAQYNVFDSCNLIVPRLTIGYTSVNIMASDDERYYYRQGRCAQYNTFSNNVIKGGYFGVSMYGQSTNSPDLGNVFTNNYFEEHGYYGFYMYYQGDYEVSDNHISNKNWTYTYGMNYYGYYCYGGKIERNFVEGLAYAIRLYYENAANSSKRTTVVNNMVTNFIQTNYQYGIEVWYSNNVELYHNSVWINPTNSSIGYAALTMYHNTSNSGNKVKNNVLVNTGMGTSFRKFSGNYGSGDINYNNYYSPSGTFISWENQSPTDISALRALDANQNQNSISALPPFADITDLHYSSGRIARFAPAITGVTIDIDHDTRYTPNTMMGCDEHQFPDYDMDIIELLTPVVPEVGTNTISFSYANTGSKEIPTQTLYFGYSINGGTWVNENLTLTSAIPPFSEPRTYTFTTPWFIGSEGNYSVSIRIYPQIANDPDASDEITVNMCTGAKGSYTIDPTGGGQFRSFTEAVNTLTRCGVAGPVVFNVNPGTYSENIVLNPIKGANATNTITFIGKGRDQTILTHAGTSYANWSTIFFNGADYFTFKDMTIRNTGSFANAVFFINSADYNSIINCDILTPVIQSTLSIPIIASGNPNSWASNGNTGNYNLIKDNTISGGYAGISWVGPSSVAFVNGNQFINNIITDYNYYGMYLLYLMDTKIEFNTVIRPMNTSNAFSIYMNYCNKSSVQANIVRPMTYGIYSIRENWNAASETSIFASNMISGFLSTTNNQGMYSSYSRNCKYLNNNIWVSGSTANNNTWAAMSHWYPYTSEAKNNILISTNNNLVMSIYMNSTAFQLNCDYNMYVYSGSTSGRFAIFTSYFPNFTAYRNFTTNIGVHDVNSYDNVDPKIQSMNNMRLEQGFSGFTGAFAPELDFDVDGKPRCKLVTFIGASEPLWSITTNDFTYEDTMCKGSPVTFFNTGLENEPHVTEWHLNSIYMTNDWHFTHNFANKQHDTITLIQQTCAGVDTVSKVVFFDDPVRVPITEFTVSKNLIEVGEEVVLHDLSLDCPENWLWEINPAQVYDPAQGQMMNAYTLINNTTLASKFPQMKFNYDGSYEVCLTVSNSVGAAQKLCKSDYINVLFSDNMCGTSFESRSAFGVLYDAGGPLGRHGVNQKCNYLIRSCAATVELVFKEFNLAEDAYLRLYDGASSSGTPLWNKDYGPKGLTGSVNDPRFETTLIASKTGMVYIEFETEDYEASGFKLEWSSIGQGNFIQPIASFNAADSGCVVEPFFFENTSTGDIASTTYYWDFNGNGVVDATTYHGSYIGVDFKGLAATYLSRLVVENCGGADTFTKKIVLINPQYPPIGKIEANLYAPVIDQDIVKLNFQPDPLNCVDTWTWQISPASFYFANETTANDKNPQIIFQDTICYSVSVLVGNSNTIYRSRFDEICLIKPKTYCNAVVLNMHSDMGISRVKLAQMDNKSDLGVKGYNNYTNDDAAFLVAGQPYDITVERNTTFNKMSRFVFIDYNNDGEFDVNDELVAYELDAKTQSWTTNFTVPITAVMGATTMRVIAAYGTTTPNPCGPFRFGEVEDYRLYISPDDVAPVIEILGNNPHYIEIGHDYVDAGARAIDNIMGDVTAYIHNGYPLFTTSINVNTSRVGSYFVTYNACDTLNNCSQVRRTVIVTPDKTPPVITFKGSDPLYINVNIPFIDTFYSAFDKADGDITANVVITGNLNEYVLGTYERTYYVEDKQGLSDMKSRTIIVIDGAAPEIALLGDNPVYVEIMTPYHEMGTVYSDNYWPKEKIAYQVKGVVDTTKAGTYYIHYSVTDYSGNGPNTVTRTVIVWDSTAPTIVAKGGDVIDHDVNTRFFDPGLDIIDNSFSGFTTTRWGTFLDRFPNEIPNQLGNFVIFYRVADASGNQSDILGRIVRVIDRHAPVLNLVGPPLINREKWNTDPDPGYTVTDNYYDVTDLTITIEDNVNVHEEGLYTYCYTPEDPSGNVGAKVCRLVRIVYEKTSIEDDPSVAKLSVYPNPSKGKFFVDVMLPIGSEVSISVHNLLGAEIEVLNKGVLTQRSFEVDMTDYAAGIYVVKVQTAENTYLERMIISK